MARLRRKPTVLPPRSDRRYGAGVGLSAAMHGAAIVLLVVGGSALGAYAGDGTGPGPVGGGGGGGSGRIQYIELPPAPASAPTTRAPEPEPAQTALSLPEPELETLPPESAQLELPRQPRRVVVIEADGAGSGTGVGPGTGTGSGGGVGSGQGTGVGRHSGPGSGGGGVALAPEPRAVLYPFEQAPPSIKGRQFTLHFWVDRRGRVTQVEIEPSIGDATFRNALLERLRQWVFYPARTVEGRPVRGELLVSYTP